MPRDLTALQPFFQLVQKAALSGVWSKGVALARDRQVSLDSESPTGDEIVLRVRSAERAVGSKVSLWPGDEDYYCDCDGPAQPCAHVSAAVSALRNGTLAQPKGAADESRVRYRFRRRDGALRFERLIGDRLLEEPLVRFVGGQASGRVPGPKLAATQDDFAVDLALGTEPAACPERAALGRLLVALRAVGEVDFEGTPVRAGTPTKGLTAELRDDGPGFRLIGIQDASITELFSNGAALCGTTLRALEDPGLTAAERGWLAPPGRWFSQAELPRLLSEIVPALERKLPVSVLARHLPKLSDEDAQAPPRLVLRMESLEEGVLSVAPAIVYASDYAPRDAEAERRLQRQLQSELHLALGQRRELRGLQALEFVQRARAWEQEGGGARAFALHERLEATFAADEQGLRVEFRAPGGSSDGPGGPAVSADPARVFAAWHAGESHVPLLGGGYAPLPADWLARFGSRIERLLAARDASADGRVPPYARPELAALAEETGGQASDALQALRARLDDFERVPEAALPPDLRAELRHYQRQGVNWLAFLRDTGMGALLADDMGLGKTLQALCAIRGRTLIVAPTSVLHSWAEQVARFRPGLRVSLYYGAARSLDPAADVTLTSYGLLRLDREQLCAPEWETAVLDEAQLIKNPESQVAQAAHSLRARFRLTLSGTPVENRAEDLWSQFQFINPGLLGPRAEFAGELARDPARLRARIRPFILRRLKREVAPELPPRTEVVLRAELSQPEREIYQALLAAGRKEVLEKLEEGGSVLGALELLLRLRQACCHPSLVPGQKGETSAKLELLSQSLEASVAQGHRALVFSQWTSFLDLIGPRLAAAGITFSRLDGGVSGERRAELVREFQSPDGPQAMLISLKAGGVGLNLTAADHVYLMDSWWNPAVEDQAADRAHRIGQENPVLVCRLIAEDTLEERIHALQKQKLELAGSVLEGSAAAVSLTRDDLVAMLS